MRLTSFLKTISLILCASVPALGASSDKAPAPAGYLHLTFTERSLVSSLEEVCRRADYIDLQRHARERSNWEYDLANESFEAFVPPHYRPDVPYGLLVFISAGEVAVSPTYYEVFSRRKLIWISANNTGNRRHGPIRMGLALDAVHNMKQRYNIDTNRVYISGFSAGASVASYMVRGYPEIYRGGLFLMGGYFYTTHKTPAGRWEATSLGMKWEGDLDRIKKDMRLILVRGSKDPEFKPETDVCQYDGLVLDGFQRVMFLVVPGCGHTHPDAAWFDKGVAALDQCPARTPPVTTPTTQLNPLPGQIAQAQRILATAQNYLEAKNFKYAEDRARPYLQQVVKEYPTTPAGQKAKELLLNIDQKLGAKSPKK